MFAMVSLLAGCVDVPDDTLWHSPHLGNVYGQFSRATSEEDEKRSWQQTGAGPAQQEGERNTARAVGGASDQPAALAAKRLKS